MQYRKFKNATTMIINQHSESKIPKYFQNSS